MIASGKVKAHIAAIIALIIANIILPAISLTFSCFDDRYQHMHMLERE
jgi:hypothetical protein